MAERFLSADEVADMLNVSRRTVERLTAERELPAVRIGRSVRYKPSAVERFIAAHTHNAVERGRGR